MLCRTFLQCRSQIFILSAIKRIEFRRAIFYGHTRKRALLNSRKWRRKDARVRDPIFLSNKASHLCKSVTARCCKRVLIACRWVGEETEWVWEQEIARHLYTIWQCHSGIFVFVYSQSTSEANSVHCPASILLPTCWYSYSFRSLSCLCLLSVVYP